MADETGFEQTASAVQKLASIVSTAMTAVESVRVLGNATRLLSVLASAKDFDFENDKTPKVVIEFHDNETALKFLSAVRQALVNKNNPETKS